MPSRDTLRTWLERSKGQSLDIAIQHIPDYDDDPYDDEHTIYEFTKQTLLPHIWRFRRLTVHLESLYDFEEIFDVLPASDTCAFWLEHLELCTTTSEVSTAITPFPIGTFRLKSLRLHGVRLGRDFAQLTSLELGKHSGQIRPNYAKFHNVLVASPALQTLILRAYNPNLPDHLPPIQA